MKQMFSVAVAVLLFGSTLTSPVRAQFPRGPSGYRTPAFSPYLNLNRRGVNPAINYYGLVRPEIEFRNSIQSLQADVSALGAETASGQSGGNVFPATGHPTQFNNLSGFFPASGARGSARPSGTAGGFTPPGVALPAGVAGRR